MLHCHSSSIEWARTKHRYSLMNRRIDEFLQKLVTGNWHSSNVELNPVAHPPPLSRSGSPSRHQSFGFTASSSVDSGFFGSSYDMTVNDMTVVDQQTGSTSFSSFANPNYDSENPNQFFDQLNGNTLVVDDSDNDKGIVEDQSCSADQPDAAPMSEEDDPQTMSMQTDDTSDMNGKSADELLAESDWKVCTDENGDYYWHVASGQIQRELPAELAALKAHSSSTATDDDHEHGMVSTQMSADSADDGCTSDDDGEDNPLRRFETCTWRIASQALEQMVARSDLPDADHSHGDLDTGGDLRHESVSSYGDGIGGMSPEPTGEIPRTTEGSPSRPVYCFSVKSLGWMPIGEDELTTDRSSRAVNRDFAYVARDRTTRQYKCHVFRCERPAKEIANRLRDICRQVLEEQERPRGAASHQSRPDHLSLTNSSEAAMPDSNRLSLERLHSARLQPPGGTGGSLLPTPVEGPKKEIRCWFVGQQKVTQASGMDLLNEAIDNLANNSSRSEWTPVSVVVAPSSVVVYGESVADDESAGGAVVRGQRIAECRIRFLSFLGIYKRDVRLCAYIMHTARDEFVAHVFYCEPTAGVLCKAMEAACKLRYQKCLDAYPPPPAPQGTPSSSAEPIGGHEEADDGDGRFSLTKSASFGSALRQGLSSVMGYFRTSQQET